MHWFEHVAKEIFDKVFTVSATSNLPAECLYVRSNPLQAQTLASSTEQALPFRHGTIQRLAFDLFGFYTLPVSHG